MQRPFQCIEVLQDKYLIAASGPQLSTVSLKDGREVSQWTAGAAPLTQTSDRQDEEEQERPAKKRKTTTHSTKAPNVIRIALSSDHAYLVVVTDDKVVTVFSQHDGILKERSRREMPKRPCAVQILPDNTSILIADKFGDVYQLPLIPEEPGNEDGHAANQKSTPQPGVHFKPSADTSTVHSQRNRAALEAQMKQKTFTARKDPIQFEHKLILGHVSMLTDMKYVVDPAHAKRGYILTADRDEHVRVSRGPPQAHIIEGFCLGHKEFISKICPVPNTELLVTGGGDDWLGLWNWKTGELLRRFDLATSVRNLSVDGPQNHKVAVAGIWCVRLDSKEGAATEDMIVVVCEKVKAVFVISLSLLSVESAEDKASNGETHAVSLETEHYPLDVASADGNLIVSMDARAADHRRLHIFGINRGGDASLTIAKQEANGEGIKQTGNIQGLATKLEIFERSIPPQQDVTAQELDSLLYGVADLRKRRDRPERNGDSVADEENQEGIEEDEE